MAEGFTVHTNTMRPSNNPTPEDNYRVVPEVSIEAVAKPMEPMTPVMDTSEG